MELEELSVVEKAAMLSGGSEWDSRGNDRADIPSFVMSDGPHGVRRQLGEGDHLGIGASKPATCFPTAGTVANSWDPALAEEMGEALGSEAHDLDVNVLLGPGLNIKRNPLCGRNFEYYSEDPIVAGRMAAGLIRGIQSNGISACPKHFAVNSQELRRQASNSVVDERTMRELYLTGFEIAVREAKPLTIMTSYNEINGVYAHENKHLLQEILRDEWGLRRHGRLRLGRIQLRGRSSQGRRIAGNAVSGASLPRVSWKARSRLELCLKPISTRVPQKSQKSRQRPSWSVLDVTICSKTISQQRITTWHARWPKAPVCC